MKHFLLLLTVIVFVSCTNGDGDVHTRRNEQAPTTPEKIDTIKVTPEKKL